MQGGRSIEFIAQLAVLCDAASDLWTLYLARQKNFNFKFYEVVQPTAQLQQPMGCWSNLPPIFFRSSSTNEQYRENFSMLRKLDFSPLTMRTSWPLCGRPRTRCCVR